jgi:GR25 family glycosyltransferase involved in LPS biosynthesis
MNDQSQLGRLRRQVYGVVLNTRHWLPKPTSTAFGVDSERDKIQGIYVINLTRHHERWSRMNRELSGILDYSGTPLSAIATRIEAVDARDRREPLRAVTLHPYYSLDDQLFVEPHPLLTGGVTTRVGDVAMTRQEIAVALSHIAVWTRVATGASRYALVLEDDVYFRRSLARIVDRAWAEVASGASTRSAFDVLYLSYKEALTGAPREPVSSILFRPLSGMWQLSGYVLSRDGAQKLLKALPVRGPVDLWMNHQFDQLDVLAVCSPVIEQRADCESSNVHSILPVLAQLGVLAQEKPLMPSAQALPGPVFAFGASAGLSSLAMALSMLGYRCCSDLSELPTAEHFKLFAKSNDRSFTAYVNIGSLRPSDYVRLADVYPGARFIILHAAEQSTAFGDAPTSGTNERTAFAIGNRSSAFRGACSERLELDPHQVLCLSDGEKDKWAPLCHFLGCDHPDDPYPTCAERGQRALATSRGNTSRCSRTAKKLKSDSSPWVAPTDDFAGIPLTPEASQALTDAQVAGPASPSSLDGPAPWLLRDDTFPGNLAIFKPNNYSVTRDGIAQLTLRHERTPVREYTSAAICSRQRFLYGRFGADLRPAAVSGCITGVFLHRNSPRQEIDIEFLGNDTRAILVNVYYNPGSDGARMEYGYRGSPALVSLDFDAADAFHRYEIEWSPTSIRWLVDGRLVHERAEWGPTPIPHLPMQFNVNLWHSRSDELGGKLAHRDLPARAELRGVHAQHHPLEGSA